MTPAERQAVLETKLDHLISAVAALTAEIEALKADVRADQAELAAIKNRGKGILIGVSLAATAMGAAVSSKIGAVLDVIAGVFK
ncbi:MAG: hypothetical protein P0Y64_02125 [Candidatus Sphingomonas colombiensis]|nr:hypothetical protein [Sphingomonas sp.]WEK43653.1 MAG: hypothetical protein P0Y64_02125 [Sphingomonas sp.]